MHGGIVYTGCLVDVDVESVIGLQLQGRLHTGLRKDSYRRVVPVYRFLKLCADAAQACLLRFLLLRVVVAGQPPRRVVACHGKLGVLLLDDKVVEHILLRKFVAQTHAVVVDTEADDDVARSGGLVEGHLQLVVVVAYGGGLAPYRGPCLVKRRGLRARHLESVHQIRLVGLARILGLGQFQS